MIKKRMQSSRPQRSRTGDHHQQNQGQQQGSRSNPRQLIEKYKTLAREAASMGDRVEAERYYQLADHYYRVTLASQPLRPEVQVQQGPMKSDVQAPSTQVPVAAQASSELVQASTQAEPVIEEASKVTPV